MKPEQVDPGTYVAPNAENPWPVADPAKPAADVEPLVIDRDNEHRVPAINLLQDSASVPAVLLPAPAPVPEPAPVAATQPTAGELPKKKKRWPVVVGALVALLVCAGVTGYFVILKASPVAKVTATPSPSPTPKPSASPSVSPTPSLTPTPSPTPSATPVPQTVTAPVTAPTASNPQTVTITSKSGLWLRSSASSVNRNNIIGWMPNGAQVSVDSVGVFWWHGKYKGVTGYFASKYTQ